jgi:hypothetical protein
MLSTKTGLNVVTVFFIDRQEPHGLSENGDYEKLPNKRPTGG